MILQSSQMKITICTNCTEITKCKVLHSILMTNTVKARVHHGADSLDITIPAQIVREEKISEGDIFEIERKREDGQLTIKYRRVYSN